MRLENPTLIAIEQGKPGFERFIGSWVFRNGLSAVVDVGPSRSLPDLVRSLFGMGLERVDLVLLTHIHIDHAGGLADFFGAFPMARAVCHAQAIGHLVDPAKLWHGSRKALGELISHYGPINPVKREWLIPHDQARIQGLRVIATPGHAAHHLSFVYDKRLFVGEAGGVYLQIGTSEYLRPATPAPFFLKECVESLDRLLEEGDLPIYYGHFGWAESSRRMLERARQQLFAWERIIGNTAAKEQGDVVGKSMERLLDEDPELRAFPDLSSADQDRERFFMAKSIEGYLGYLRSLD